MKRQIKIAMRLLAEDGTSGTVCYRLTYGRKSRDVASTHKVLVSEWDALKGEITDRDADGDRRDFLHDVRLLLAEDVDRLQTVKWEKCMQEIVDRYATGDSVYLLPIIDSNSNVDERRQYLNMAHNVNRSLKTIGELLGLSMPLTMYVARHSWASIARSKNVPLSVISAGMGHDSEATTRIYLAELDTIAVDKANSMILRSL
mgnify:FL=1